MSNDTEESIFERVNDIHSEIIKLEEKGRDHNPWFEMVRQWRISHLRNKLTTIE